MQTCVPQIAVLKDPPNVFSWEIDIFSDCYFQEHFEATTSAFYPMAQNMPKGDIKTIQSPALRHSFIHCPQTSLCQLWTDIFIGYLSTFPRNVLMKKPAAAPAHICTNGLSLSTPA